MRYQVLIQPHQSLLQKKSWYNTKWRTIDKSYEHESPYEYQRRCKVMYKKKIILIINKK